MKPAGLAVAQTRRPAKPGRGADAAAPSRRQATHRHDGVRGRAQAHAEFVPLMTSASFAAPPLAAFGFSIEDLL